jgi:hypothetical protein
MALVTVATIFPLSVPSLAVGLAWALGHGFPRELDWKEARTLAEITRRDGLTDRIVHSYYDSLSAAMAVYEPRLRQQYGHWGEVRPRLDPARELSAAAKVYILPVPPDDPVLARLAGAGWLKLHGGSALTSVATLGEPQAPPKVAPVLAQLISEEAAWLARHAFNNRFPPLRVALSPQALASWRARRAEQRTHAGRISAAVLVYAYALEASKPEIAAGVRRSVRAWGSVANFIGDETAMDYLSDARFARFRENVQRFSREVLALQGDWVPPESLNRATDELFADFFAQDEGSRLVRSVR